MPIIENSKPGVAKRRSARATTPMLRVNAPKHKREGIQYKSYQRAGGGKAEIRGEGMTSPP
jgi:hypothetical protein